MTEESRKKILLVEDEVVIALSEKMDLEKYGYIVITVNTAEKAVKTVEEIPDIDLVLMDIDLGKGMDGTQVAEMILLRIDIPLVFLSSHAEPEVVEKTEKITSYGYVVKDSSITVLDASIKMAFKLFEANRKTVNTEIKQNKMISNISDVILIVDKDGINRYNSPNIKKHFGWEPEKITGMVAWDTVHPDDLERMKKFHETLSAPGATGTTEYRFKCQNGSYKWIEITVVNLLNDPVINGYLGNYHDISQRKKIEEEKHFEQMFAEKVLDSLPGIFYLYTYPELRLVRWNKNHETLLGYGPGEIANRYIMEWHVPGVEQIVQEAVDLVMEKGMNILESPLLNKDGVYIPFLMTGVRFETEEQLYLMGIGIDVTDRKKAEAALRESQETLNMILNTIPQSIFWKDIEGRYMGCNRVFAEAAGFDDPEKIIGLTDFDLPWPKDEAEAYRADDRQVIESNMPKLHIREPLLQSDGTHIVIDTSKVPLHNPDGIPFGVLGIYENIETKHAGDAEIKDDEGGNKKK